MTYVVTRRDWGTPQKIVITFASNPTDIWSGHLPSTSLERYRYINLFGVGDDDDDDMTGTKRNLNSNEQF
jgi:hypothetical protein